MFCSFVVETRRPMCDEALQLLHDLGGRLSTVSGNVRER